MKLNDLHKMSLGTALSQMDLVDMKVHTDDEGEIKTVEIKYVPVPPERPVPPVKAWDPERR